MPKLIASFLLGTFVSSAVFASAKFTGFQLQTCRHSDGFCMEIQSPLAYVNESGTAFAFDEAQFTFFKQGSARRQRLSGRDVYYNRKSKTILVRQLTASRHRQAFVNLQTGHITYFD